MQPIRDAITEHYIIGEMSMEQQMDAVGCIYELCDIIDSMGDHIQNLVGQATEAHEIAKQAMGVARSHLEQIKRIQGQNVECYNQGWSDMARFIKDVPDAIEAIDVLIEQGRIRRES